MVGWFAKFTHERGQVALFALIWVAVVILPMLGLIFVSFLTPGRFTIYWEGSLEAYRNILASGRLDVLGRTFLAAAVVTAICFVLGFPFALWLAKRAKSRALIETVQLCLTVPFFLDPSARMLVWRTVLGSKGTVNTALMQSGAIHEPISWLLYSDFAVYLGLIGPYFPNMVWPLYLSIALIDDDLIAASRDLGAGPLATLRTIILPLALPGVVAGIIFTFVPILGDNVVPAILGGSKHEYLADSVMSLVTSMNYVGAGAFAAIILAVMWATGVLIGLFVWLGGRRAVTP